MIIRGYANSRDGQIHYRESGKKGQPVICFFHQTASSGVMFEKVMMALGDAYHCYSYDSPGFGQSYQPDNIPSVAYMGDRILEAIDDLGVKSFHGCGHHTGGCALLEIAAASPDRLQSVTIIAPVVVNEQEREEYKKTFVRPFAIEPTGKFLETAWAYLDMIGAGGNVDLHTRELADHLTAHRTMPMAFSAVWQQDVGKLLMAVSAPLLLMCSKDDVLWPLFGRACEMRPDAEQAIVGGGDFQPDNDPEGVAHALRAFIDKL